MKFMDLSYQLNNMGNEIFEKLEKIIHSSSFIGGEEINLFEEEFSEYIKSDYCIGVGNGTDALEIAIESLEMPPNSEIIIPANSFIASSEAVTRSGHRVVFSDVDRETLLITPKEIDKVITPKTKAVMCVHLYGNPCNLIELKNYCKNHDLFLIEDCAQAHGAKYEDLYVGSSGDIAAWSFYPGKNLGAFGDAGAITTNIESLAIQSKKIANHGRIDKYNHLFEGRNSRLDNLQAAVLRIKLKYLDDWTLQRIKNAEKYIKSLNDVTDIKLQKIEDNAKHVFHLFVIQCQKRDELKEYLNELNISTGIHYPILLPQLEAYEYMKNDVPDKLLKDDLANTLLSLPVSEHLNEKDIEYISIKIKEFF